MIRRAQTEDLDQIMTIWLQENIRTHYYVARSYWENNYDDVKAAIAQSLIYVAVKEGEIIGFIGLVDDYIAGIFVKADWQSHGIGQQLLAQAKTVRSQLTLEVYRQNEKAIHFYQMAGFKLVEESIDPDTNQVEYLLKWVKSAS